MRPLLPPDQRHGAHRGRFGRGTNNRAGAATATTFSFGTGLMTCRRPVAFPRCRLMPGGGRDASAPAWMREGVCMRHHCATTRHKYTAVTLSCEREYKSKYSVILSMLMFVVHQHLVTSHQHPHYDYSTSPDCKTHTNMSSPHHFYINGHPTRHATFMGANLTIFSLMWWL